MPIVAKIETQLAFDNLPDLIVQAAGANPFAVMIARGDLAVEVGYERLSEVQEEILWLCEAAHVPVIWATQVLESLVKRGMPSRGEFTDAAMAQRAECVMLNKGPFIHEGIVVLDNVLRRMETHKHKRSTQLRPLKAWSEVALTDRRSSLRPAFPMARVGRLPTNSVEGRLAGLSHSVRKRRSVSCGAYQLLCGAPSLRKYTSTCMPIASGPGSVRSTITSTTSTSVSLRGPRELCSAGSDDPGDRGDLALELASAKGVGAHDDRLPDAHHADIPLVELRPHAQGGNIGHQYQRLIRRRRRDLADLGVDLQHGSGDRRADARLLEHDFGQAQFGARRVELALGPVRQRRVRIRLDAPQARRAAAQAVLRAHKCGARRVEVCFRSAAAAPVGRRLVEGGARIGKRPFGIGELHPRPAAVRPSPAAPTDRCAHACAPRPGLRRWRAAPAPLRRRGGSAPRRRTPCRWV